MTNTHLLTPAAFFSHAFKLPVPTHGDLEGNCVICGLITTNGLSVKKEADWIIGRYFTAITETKYPASNVVCPHCIGMGQHYNYKKLGNKSIQTAFNSRLTRSITTESGKVYFIGNDECLKWMLHNMPDEPFLMINERRAVDVFKHVAWLAQVSLSKDAFYYCDESGAYLVHLSRVQSAEIHPEMTKTERMLHKLYHGDKSLERAQHPRKYIPKDKRNKKAKSTTRKTK